MNINEMQDRLQRQIEIESRYDVQRSYVGISQIADCPRKIYNAYFQPSVPDEATYRFCFAGYDQQDGLFRLLVSAGIAKNETADKEVVSPFDNRFRGHIDGETNDSNLLEIKSVTVAKFNKIRENGKADFKHFAQVQLYMRYGGWKNAFVFYRCRETYEHLIIHVPYIAGQADKFERKAVGILQAIDAKSLPACECGRCK